jgi:hypothetical protein
MNKLRFLFTALLAGLFLSGCLKKDFDNPPDVSGFDPGVPAGTTLVTIAQLKAMNGPYNSSTNYDTTLIQDDVSVAGIVVADDRSGNYYKQIVIQDSTGGIAVDIDAYSLYNNYPVGRKIYIKCKGLYLGYNGGTPELGGGIDERLAVMGMAGTQIDAHVVKANVGNEVKDTVVSFLAVTGVSSSNSPLINRLVTISDSVEFQDQGVSYTSPSATTNRYVTPCAAGTNPKTLVVRTSNYANFHAITLPTGRGKIRGILTIYKTSYATPQLILRDTGDVMMYGPRCGGSISSNAPIVTIDSVRKLYPGSGTYAFTNPLRITGVVISDIDNKNVSSGNFVIEDASHKGITMYISGSSTYKLGDSVVVDLSGATMKIYVPTGQTVGSLEIDGITASNVSVKANGKTIAPIQVTISQINTVSGIAPYESVLVKIVSATASGGTTYGGNRTLTDATGTMSLYTSTTATFANSNMPTGAKTFIGIATPYGTSNELKIRNTTDVQ